MQSPVAPPGPGSGRQIRLRCRRLIQVAMCLVDFILANIFNNPFVIRLPRRFRKLICDWQSRSANIPAASRSSSLSYTANNTSCIA